MINLLHVYIATALALAFLFPSKFSYKDCWLFPLDMVTLAFFTFGRAIDYSFKKQFN